jgi:hypothetical protein
MDYWGRSPRGTPPLGKHVVAGRNVVVTSVLLEDGRVLGPRRLDRPDGCLKFDFFPLGLGPWRVDGTVRLSRTRSYKWQVNIFRPNVSLELTVTRAWRGGGSIPQSWWLQVATLKRLGVAGWALLVGINMVRYHR